MPSPRNWISAMRLRTLPLSLSGILLGSGVAYYQGFWDGLLFGLALCTTVLFQIVSNFANDLGDSQKGTDNAERIGPARTVQSGVISQSQMKRAVAITAMLALISAGFLIYFGTRNMPVQMLIFYAVLAVLCVLAAILYTVGGKAYGYHGLGDIMVFIFFGGVSVLGVYSLYAKSFLMENIHLAIFAGLMSTAVMNLNNMRDYHNDKRSGKNTVVVRMGPNAAKFYHMLLIMVALLSLLLFLISLNKPLLFTSTVPVVFIILHLYKVMRTQNPKDFDPELKKVALSTFAISLFLMIGLILVK